MTSYAHCEKSPICRNLKILEKLTNMRYYVKIYNERSDEMIEVLVEADSEKEAIDKIFSLEKAQEMMKDWEDVTEVECHPIEDAVLDKDRFLLQPSKEEGWYVLTDTQLLITLRFRAGDFNGSQKVTLLDDSHITNPMDIATSLRLMGDWIQKYHRELI